MTHHFTTPALMALIPFVAFAGPSTASVSPGGKTITITFKADTLELNALPAFDITGFMAKGAAGMKPGYYRLGGEWKCDLKPTITKGSYPRWSEQPRFNAVRVYSPDRVVPVFVRDEFNPKFEDSDEKPGECKLKTGVNFIIVAPTETLESMKTSRNGLAMPTAGEINDKLDSFTRIIRQAMFTEPGKLTVSSVYFRSDPPKTKTGIRLFSPTPDSWKVTGCAVNEGIATPVAVIDKRPVKARHETLLKAYMQKQPEPIRSLLLATTPDEMPDRKTVDSFYRTADKATLSTLASNSKSTRFFITQEDIGVPEEEREPGWNGNGTKVLYDLNLLNILPWKARDDKSAPDQAARRYLKVMVELIPELTAYNAAEGVADTVMWRYDIPLLTLNSNGVTLRIEHFPDGAATTGVIKAPPGKERDARVMLRDALLQEMARR